MGRPTARRGGGLPAGGLPARTGRRSGGGRRGRGRNDRGRHPVPARRGSPGAYGAPQEGAGIVSRVRHREIHSDSEEDTVNAGREFASQVRAAMWCCCRAPSERARRRSFGGSLRVWRQIRQTSPARLSPSFRSTAAASCSSTSDLYRLAPAEVDDLGLEELMESAVLAVEWPDRGLRAPPRRHPGSSIEPGKGDHRTITRFTTPRGSSALPW